MKCNSKCTTSASKPAALQYTMSVMVVVGLHTAQANFIDIVSIGLCQSSSGQGEIHNVSSTCYSFCYSETNGVPLASTCRSNYALWLWYIRS